VATSVAGRPATTPASRRSTSAAAERPAASRFLALVASASAASRASAPRAKTHTMRMEGRIVRSVAQCRGARAARRRFRRRGATSWLSRRPDHETHPRGSRAPTLPGQSSVARRRYRFGTRSNALDATRRTQKGLEVALSTPPRRRATPSVSPPGRQGANSSATESRAGRGPETPTRTIRPRRRRDPASGL